MITISILTIMVAMAAPSFSNLLNSNTINLTTTDPSANTCTPNSNTLYLIKGSHLKGLNIKHHSSYASLKIDKLQGHPDFLNGEVKVDWLTFEKESGKAITMQMNLFGRLYRCGVGGKWYGADVCT